MKNFVWLLGTFMVLSACNHAETNTKVEVVYNESIIETVGKNKGLAESKVEIKGMSCEIMCGTAIKDGIASLSGVESVEIDFDAERETNFALVKYQTNEISPEDITSQIQSLKKGAYSVIEVNTSKWIEKEGGEQPLEENNSETEKTAYINIVDIVPSVFNVLAKVIQ